MVRTEGKLSKEKTLDLTLDLAMAFSREQEMEGEKFCDELTRELTKVSKASREKISDQCSQGLAARKHI